MRVIWKLVLVFHVLISFPAIYRCSSQENIDALILHHKEFSFDKILVQFHENEKIVLYVSKIKYFFVFPNNFYCEHLKVNDESLPLFFIESTKKNFFSLILSLLNTNEDVIRKLLDKILKLNPDDDDILILKRNLQRSFPHTNSIQDIEKEIVQSIILPDKNNLIRNLENGSRLLSNVNSMQDLIENSNENIVMPTLEHFLQNWKFKMRYIIPAVYLKNIFFVPKQGKHASENSNCNVYLKYDDHYFSDNVDCIGSGSYGSCYKVTIQTNTKSSHENFVLKMLRGKIKPLKEIAIFSHIPIEEQFRFCRPQSIVIGSDGKGAGFLMKYAEFGNLANFTANHQVKDYRYFYNQLFSIAKAINLLHQNDISHNDVKMDNIFVFKKDDTEVRNNYYFQLGDFGISYINYLYDYDEDCNSILSNEHAKEIISGSIVADCSSFVLLLPKVLRSLYLMNENNSQQEPLMLTMTLKDPCKFDEIERYFKDVDDSFTTTNPIKSSEMSECSNLESYKFTKTPENFVVLYHTPARCVSYSEGEILTLDDRFEHKLYGMNYTISSFDVWLDLGIMDSINQFYKLKCKIKDVLVKVNDYDS